MAPIGGLDKMKSQLEKALNYSDCREAMQKLLAQIGSDTKFAPSTPTDRRVRLKESWRTTVFQVFMKSYIWLAHGRLIPKSC